MTAPYGHAARILELAGELRAIADKIERETAAGIVETRTTGLFCAGEFQWNSPEVSTHDVAPPDDGFAGHDDPPSKPL